MAVVLILAGCGRSERPRAPAPELAIDVRSDTSRAVRLRIEPPRVWLERVAIAPPASMEVPLPDAESDTAPPDTTPPPGLEIDPRLKAPILRSAAPLVLPPAASPGEPVPAATVELDVHVSEAGEVTEARRAGGSRDSALVAAATACARSMVFRPALLGGRPVAVWCRQRFDFPAR